MEQEAHDAEEDHIQAIPDVHTSVEVEADDVLDSGPFHEAEVDKASRGEGRLG